MIMNAASDLDQQLSQFAQRLPPKLGRVLLWLWQPSRIWLRVPLAIALVVGGLLSFLPVLGIWMLPLGLVLAARDIPFLQAPMARMLAWIETRWPRRKSSPGTPAD
jgi:hypothetical protein